MRDTNTTVTIDGGLRSDGNVGLRIIDGPSGTLIVELELTAAEWVGLTTGRMFAHSAWVTPFLDRIGKQMRHRQIDVPHEVTDRIRTDYQKTVVQNWGDNHAEPGETVEPRSTNQGWKVIFRRYEAAE